MPSSRTPAVLLAGLTVVGLLAGCVCHPPSGLVDQCQASLSLPPTISTDILFVIDDSGSMAAKQAKLVQQLQTFVQALATAPVKNDFQLGVITTSIVQNWHGCAPGSPVRQIDYPLESGRLQLGRDLAGHVVPGSVEKILGAADPDLVAKATVLLGQGVVGSGEEMGLEAARRAVSEPLRSTPLDGGNLGFLRPGARLLVVIVSDEDDCSDPTGHALAVSPICPPACTSDSECGDGGPGNYCLPIDPADPGAGRQCVFDPCTTPAGRAVLEPVETYANFFHQLDDGYGRPREVFLAVIGAFDENTLQPARCLSSSGEAYAVATRYRQAIDLMMPNAYLDSICRSDYGTSLQSIAALVNAPQSVDLAEAPADPHLIVFEVTRADSAADGGSPTIQCRVGDGFDYAPAVSTDAGVIPARVTFKGDCRLRSGDHLALTLACVN